MAVSVTSLVLISLGVLMIHITASEAQVRVDVSDAVKQSYTDIVVNKAHRYAIFSILNDKLDVENYGDSNANYDQFLNDIKKGGSAECRYGLYDHEIKPFILFWCPDSAKLKQKLLYSGAIEDLRNTLPDVMKTITTDASADEIAHELRG